VVAQSRGEGDSFGGNNQQDADEFLSFLLDQVDDETNTCRDQSLREGEDQPQGTNERNLLQSAEAFWNKQLTVNDSIIDKFWRGVEMQTTKCLQCNTRTYRFMPFLNLSLQVANASDISLDKVLQTHMSDSSIEGFECDTCCKKFGKTHRTTAVMKPSFPRLPKLLRLSFKCFTADLTTKLSTYIGWDFDNVDFTNLTLPGVEGGKSDFTGSSRYQCYAVILHQGSSIDRGHYIAYIRDRRNKRDVSSWLRCNDTYVTPMRVKGSNNDVEKDRRDNFLPYIAFFQQKEH
jgi:ubiquitin carboxyl-terminal hydrolase 8